MEFKSVEDSLSNAWSITNNQSLGRARDSHALSVRPACVPRICRKIRASRVCDCTNKMRPACKYAVEKGRHVFMTTIWAARFAAEKVDAFLIWMAQPLPGFW